MARIAPAEYERIVVAVDDSEESMHATAVAAQLVSQKGELVFVHVLEVPLEFPLDATPPPGEEAARRDGRELLARCEAAADRYGVSSRRALRRQHVAGPAIVEAADQFGAGLIVIAGDRRFARSGRLRLGATATYVLKHADCRVMVVSAPAEPVAATKVA
ncbi:MAG TPA: universal stress protein [Gaiellaceae bacterium]|jgi:nucleotide-binding universal stress UspA family protein|nr:universal stress protein [Gaiellaceae bacterium]